MHNTALPSFSRYHTTLLQLAGDIKQWMPAMTLNGHLVTLELLVYGRNKANYTYPLHIHPVYESHLCLEGHAQYTLAERHDIEPGMVLLHAPQQPHSWTTADDPWTILVLWFYIDPPPLVPFPVRWPVTPEVLLELELLLTDYQHRIVGWQDRTIARMTAITSRILCLAEMAPIEPRTYTPDEILGDNIRAFLLRNLGQPLQVADIARFAGKSVRSLHRWFHQHTGQSLMTYLLDLRMQRAAELLMRTAQSPRAIGEIVGMPETSYFCRRFRAYFATSPQQYRQIHSPHYLDSRPIESINP